MTAVDSTHAPDRRSWVASANGHADFPIQNLPLGVFSPPGERPRGGVAIGDKILDLASAVEAGFLIGEAADLASRAPLNAFLALGAPGRIALRTAVADLLDAEGEAAAAAQALEDLLLHDAADCRLYLPTRIGDYTDFYAGIHHAVTVGKLFRPDSPLLPNYKYVPIGYHGRASSIRPSGTPVRRPKGQLKSADEAEPRYAPVRRLDMELELGVWLGPANALGETTPIAEAAGRIAGFCLLNDWSARDIQAWEYQPLGPFLSKNFATTISPWIVTPEALAPFRAAQPARPQGDPRPLDYLWDDADQAGGALGVDLEVTLSTVAMRAAGLPDVRVTKGTALNLYWTVAQLVTHHASGGCDLQPGDLLGTGTISGPTPDAMGSMLEITAGGSAPLTLPSGETRSFFEDGDEVVLRARAIRDGFVSIGFGECRAQVLPAG